MQDARLSGSRVLALSKKDVASTVGFSKGHFSISRVLKSILLYPVL